MDPIGASCFSLHIEENNRAILEEQKQDEKFSEIIVSCGSLSRYERKSLKCLLPQILASAIAASFHIVVGISLAFSAILIPQLREQADTFPMTLNESSWIASIIVLVVPVGAMLGGFLMDSIGRLNTVKLATIPGVLGWCLIAMATNVPMLLAGRLLTGLASALGSSPAIVYITEIARADMRGSLISFAPAYASMGMVMTYFKGWFLGWRIVAWSCCAYTVLPCLLCFLIPDSPVWLVSRDRGKLALRSLQWINKYQPQPIGKGVAEGDSLAQLQLTSLQRDHLRKMDEAARRPTSTITAFRKPTGYKPLLILIGLFLFQQFSGIYIMLFYSISFFEEVGSTMNAYLASILIGTVRFFMSIINTYMLRTFRRRPLIMCSAIGMALCMLVSSIFTMRIKDGVTDVTWVPVASILLYVITSMIGLLPIPWTMTAELFPIEIRGVAHSIAYSMANILMFASVQSYESLIMWFGGAAGVQVFFGIVAICGALYTLVFLPETHGKKLTDIEHYFEHNTVYLVSTSRRLSHKSNTRTPKPRTSTGLSSNIVKDTTTNNNSNNNNSNGRSNRTSCTSDPTQKLVVT